MIVRTEILTDIAAIRLVVAAAFKRSDEAILVDRLREHGDCVISLVAVDGGGLVGHVLFSQVTAPFRALGLGPVAVIPERQRVGIGSRLIREGLEHARQGGWEGVFVLGNPGYYRRFGFAAALAGGFQSPYRGVHFMALALGAALPAVDGIVEYAPAFRLLV